MHHLDNNNALHLQVMGAVNNRHAAFAEHALDQVFAVYRFADQGRIRLAIFVHGQLFLRGLFGQLRSDGAAHFCPGAYIAYIAGFSTARRFTHG